MAERPSELDSAHWKAAANLSLHRGGARCLLAGGGEEGGSEEWMTRGGLGLRRGRPTTAG